MGTVDLIFIGKKTLDAMSALENNPKSNTASEFINASLHLFGNYFALSP